MEISVSTFDEIIIKLNNLMEIGIMVILEAIILRKGDAMKKYIIALILLVGVFTFSVFRLMNSIDVEDSIETNRTAIVTILTTATSYNKMTVKTKTTTAATAVAAKVKESVKTTSTTSVVTTLISVTTVTEKSKATEPAESETVTETQLQSNVETQEVQQETTTEIVDNQSTEETVDEETTTNTAETPKLTYLGNLKITGYTSTGSPTASGEYPYVGGVAMSSGYDLPFNTKIYIEGIGYFTINDTGCSYGVVDVFCNSESECYNLTSYADVYIVN